MPEASGLISDRVRSACEWVAGRARSVRIEAGALAPYAAGLPDNAESPAPDPATELVEGDREARAAFVLCLDAINFGSGWWPTIRKRSGRSGYFTIAAGLTERFRDSGPWSAAELAELEAEDVAAAVGQDAAHPLMAHYAAALNDVGDHVGADHGSRFEAVVEAAQGSAPALAGQLAEWRAFADASTYEGRLVPFFKRAQIAAADLDRMGVAELLEHDSPEEVELRACAVHAIELLSAATLLVPAEIDAALWSRGAAQRYKSLPRPRSRNTAY